MKIDEKTLLVAVAVVGGFIYWSTRRTLNAINPLNNDNAIANTVDSALGLEAQGSSLGSYIYDLFHREYDPNE